MIIDNLYSVPMDLSYEILDSLKGKSMDIDLALKCAYYVKQKGIISQDDIIADIGEKPYKWALHYGLIIKIYQSEDDFYSEQILYR